MVCLERRVQKHYFPSVKGSSDMVEYMKIAIWTGVIASILLITAMVNAPRVLAHANATGVVKERMDNFKATRGHLKAISRLLGSTEFDEIASRASAMREWGLAMPAAFPEGSDGKPSEAASAIWTDNEGFIASASSHVAALDAMIAAADAGDAGAVGAAFKAVAGTCKACHIKYREF